MKLKTNVVGLNMQRLRTQKKITLKQLETKSGVALSVLCRAEKGETTPTLSNIMAIARGLGCRVEEIMYARVT